MEDAAGLLEEKKYDEWEKHTFYTRGDIVICKGQLCRAKWWTRGEQTGKSDVWKSLGTTEEVARVKPDIQQDS